ncbi:MAG: tRNA uridine-5-carboxymethylaminomethyl(34) synthesis GTPase MnmE [Clostridia bacterium]|nr:tRNA uridine-5-carboxymethylaminomethyl(34) synthesis GTPase MnmE [Clostridia bacterium]
MNFYDTIAALSSPIGKGGVAVIRISGSEAFEIAERVFKSASGKKISELKPNMMTYGQIISEEKIIDDGLCVKFCAPRSFTGEDTVEINCHGGIFITQKVLSAIFSAGARPAEAGEFTRRAFVNGKMALSQAEALGTLLEAKNDEQVTLARSAMGGKIKDACDSLYRQLVSLVAQVYAKVDYPEEDLADMDSNEMAEATRALLSDVSALKSTYKTGHAVMEGVRTVICGKPNVGKSSLYNRLVGREAAIVTEIEGTTRDILTETVSLGRVTLRLVDTAGIRDTEDTVEKIGVERAKKSLDEAELVLAVFDNSRSLDDGDFEIISALESLRATKIALINKDDEETVLSEQILREKFDRILRISAKNDNGLDELRSLVEELYINEEIDTQNDAVLINARQHASLVQAEKHLTLALEALELGLSPDLAGVDLELAMSYLSEIDGREVDEDIVAEIFSHFCVG